MTPTISTFPSTLTASDWTVRQFSSRNLCVWGGSVAAGAALVRSRELFKERKYFDHWAFRVHSAIVDLSPRQKAIGKIFILALMAVAVCAIAPRVRPLFNGSSLSFRLEQISDYCVTAFVAMGSFVGTVYFSSTFQFQITSTPPFLSLKRCHGSAVNLSKETRKEPILPTAQEIAEAARKRAVEKRSQEMPLVTFPHEVWEEGVFPYLLSADHPDLGYNSNLRYGINLLVFRALALVCKTFRNLLYDEIPSSSVVICRIPFYCRKFRCYWSIPSEIEQRSIRFSKVSLGKLKIISSTSGENLINLLHRYPELTKLTLESREWNVSSFGNCSLECLSIEIGNAGRAPLKSALINQTCLKKLKLYYCDSVRANDIIFDADFFVNNPIKELHLEGFGYSTMEAEAENNFKLFLNNMTSMTKLALWDVPITGACLEGLPLEELVLTRYCKYFEVEPLGRALRGMQTLKKLTINIRYCIGNLYFAIDKEQLEAFAHVWDAFKDLKVDEFSINFLEKEESLLFFQNVFPTLSFKKLRINWLKLDEESYDFLSQLIALGPKVTVETIVIFCSLDEGCELLQKKMELFVPLVIELRDGGVEKIRFTFTSAYLNWGGTPELDLALEEGETASEFYSRTRAEISEGKENKVC